jgi:para-nitrobenzyl esterase
VGSLLGLPAARGLFHKAIPQSGACHTANPLETSVRVAERVTQLLGSRDLGDVSAEQLIAAQAELLPAGVGSPTDPALGGMPLQPCVDGSVLPALPIDSVLAGSAAGVPILVGSTRDEWRLFGAIDPAVAQLDGDGLRERLAEVPGGAGLISAYQDARAKRDESTAPADLFMAIETDRIFRMPGVLLAERQRAHENRVYSYLVTWPSPLMGGLLGSPHAVELGPLFGIHDQTEETASFFGRGPAADELARVMQEGWTSFARSGEPSSSGLGSWPAYTPERRATVVLGEACAIQDAPLDDERRAFDSIPDRAIGSL